jgi:hypothetical protein
MLICAATATSQITAFVSADISHGEPQRLSAGKPLPADNPDPEDREGPRACRRRQRTESTVALPEGRRSLTGLFLGARRLVAPGHGQFR